MRRILSLLVAVLLLSAVGFEVVAQENVTEGADEPSEESLNIPPGLHLSMVLSQIRMEIKGNATAVMLKYRLMHNANESEVADIMINKTEELRELIQEKLREKERLIEEYQNGEINETEFAVEMLRINMEFRNAVKELMALEECYGRFKESVKLKLMEKGINATAIEMLKIKAREMSGEDVREIAKMIKMHRMGKMINEKEIEKEFRKEHGKNESESEKEEEFANETNWKVREKEFEIEKEVREENMNKEEFKEKMKEISEEIREKMGKKGE